MAATVNVNGVFFDEAHAVIPVFDHGFLYGEGVYETLRTYGGRPFLFERHMRRLRRSAAMIALPVPLSDDQIAERFAATQREAGLTGGPGREAYIRLLLTRGVGDLTYDPAATPAPSVVIIVKPHAELPAATSEHGVSIVIVPIVRNHPASVDPRIKSNNLLNNALAAQHAIRQGAFEGLMRNHRGELTELSTANLFVVKSGIILTPALDAGLLPGITREFVFELGARLDVAVREATLHDADLYNADEAFLTSTTREALPITRVDGRPIGDGAVGPVTRRLMTAFRDAVAAEMSESPRPCTPR
ncbi:MAG: aminotransferase class IV [Vicinamibacterales bacterium]